MNSMVSAARPRLRVRLLCYARSCLRTRPMPILHGRSENTRRDSPRAASCP